MKAVKWVWLRDALARETEICGSPDYAKSQLIKQLAAGRPWRYKATHPPGQSLDGFWADPNLVVDWDGNAANIRTLDLDVPGVFGFSRVSVYGIEVASTVETAPSRRRRQVGGRPPDFASVGKMGEDYLADLVARELPLPDTLTLFCEKIVDRCKAERPVIKTPKWKRGAEPPTTLKRILRPILERHKQGSARPKRIT